MVVENVYAKYNKNQFELNKELFTMWKVIYSVEKKVKNVFQKLKVFGNISKKVRSLRCFWLGRGGGGGRM